jgi:hypothetical protein
MNVIAPKSLFIGFCGDNIIVLIVDVIFLSYVIKKKSLLPNFPGGISEKGEIILKIVAACVLFYVFLTATLPSALDIPYVVKQEYCIDEGIVVEDCGRVSKGTRPLEIENKNGEIINISLHGSNYDIPKGEYVVIGYLPHSKYGFIVK